MVRQVTTAMQCDDIGERVPTHHTSWRRAVKVRQGSAVARGVEHRVEGLWFPGSRALGRCSVMGIVNVTPDSFSDGGRFATTDSAVLRGFELSASGADLIDIGGESTRPGADRVPISVELERTVDVVAELAASRIAVSIDTTRAVVAEAAVAAGAVMVNDVSGGLADPDMACFIAQANIPYVVMHWRGPSLTMQKCGTHYIDVVSEVCRELQDRMFALIDAGVRDDNIILDPGLGFAKKPEHNWQILNRFDEIMSLGRPILVGASRKSFLEKATCPAGNSSLDHRDSATAAVSALAAAAGAHCVRVHDVESTLAAVRVAAAWDRGA